MKIMYHLDKETIENHCFQLENLIRRLERSLEGAPQGSLQINYSGKNPKYYQRTPGADSRRVYLSKKNFSTAAALAQKDYNNRTLKILRGQHDALLKFSKKYPFDSLDKVYEALPADRRVLVCPVFLTDEQYVGQWQDQSYTGRDFRPDDTSAFYTSRGERVRSKSEVIIADALSHAGIPYKYECPLRLGNFVVYPDFTLLDIQNREEKIFEHFGMVDNAEYAQNMVRKINTYIMHGYIPGENFLFTMESSEQALDTRILKKILEENFQPPAVQTNPAEPSAGSCRQLRK